MRWRTEAACRDKGVEVFFAKRTSPEGRQAVAICDTCPVRAECLADCLAGERIRLGIRGGLGPYEREEHVRRSS
jgi:WhiB family redox-sensing transcriptional regulator